MTVEEPLRLLIIGISGSGKSTLAKDLSVILDIKHIELDQFYFRDNWQEVPWEEFRHDVQQALDSSLEWCMDGNYIRQIADITWPKATHIIYLKYGFWTVFSRLFRRTMLRCWYKNQLFGHQGCTETFYKTFFDTQESILWFVIKTYSSYHARLTKLITTRELLSDDAVTITFTSPRETDLFLQQIVQTRSLKPLSNFIKQTTK